MSLMFRYLVRTTGIALIVVSIAMLPSVAVSVLYKEYAIALAFCKVLPVALVLGIIMYKSFKHSFDRLRISDGLLMVTWGWIIAAIIGAAPYVLSGCIPSWVDAFFESCSGFTTTGATILPDVESLPHGILFWRSSTSWLGGVSILLIAIAIFPSLGLSGQSIISTETKGPVLEQPSPRRRNHSKAILTLYCSFTALEILFFCIGGMGIFDAFIHSFGSVSTGGFSNYNDSLAHFNSNFILAVMTIFMVLCGVNFNLYYQAFRRGPRSLLGDSELRLYLFFVIVPACVLFAGLYPNRADADIGSAAANSFFQSVSMLTTTGYTIGNYQLWPQFCQVVLLFLMFIGSCSSSVSGGLKVIRFVILGKLVRHGISMRLHPQYYEAIKVNKNSVPPDIVSGVCNYTFLYIILVFIGTIAVSFDASDMTTAFTAAVACISNIGHGFGEVGATGSFAGFSAFSKIIFSLLMVAGRLEIYTFFILFSPHYWTQKY